MIRDYAAAPPPNPSFLLPRSHSHFGSHPSPIAGKTIPLFSYTCVEPILQTFCFQIHAWNGGCVPPGVSSAYPLLRPCRGGSIATEEPLFVPDEECLS